MITCLQVNLGRGREAQDLLQQTAIENGVDLLLVSEQYKPGTGIWFQDKTSRAAIAVLNKNLTIGEVDDSTANHVWVDVEGIRIFSCYFSPNDPYEEFVEQLSNLEENLQRSRGHRRILVAGDFNCKSPEWGSKRLDYRGELLSEMMARFDLVALNEGTDYTFRRGSTGSVVDVTFATNHLAGNVSNWKVLEHETLSDHQYVWFEIEYNLAQQKRLKRREQPGQKNTAAHDGWVLRKLDKLQLRKSLESSKQQGQLQLLAQRNDPEKMVDYALQTIIIGCDTAMPRRKKHPRQKTPVYWWTTEIAELRKKCLSARRKMQRAKNVPEKVAFTEEYKEVRKELRSAIKTSKRKCWKDLCRSVEEDPWGLPYTIVTKKMVGREQIPGIKNPERMENIVTTLFPKHAKRAVCQMSQDDEQILPFTIEELREAGKRLRRGKAPGPDCIPNEVIAEVVEVWPELLLEVFNTCLQTGIFPERWKRQVLVLLRKGNKPLEEPSSYRPICLLDTVGKLLERMILQRLEAHVEADGGLSKRQFGFRKGRSTVDAISEVIKKAETETKRPWRSKGYCALITLDIRNAFNSARWDRIMEALTQRHTPQYLQKIVDSYLADRTLIYNTEDGDKVYEITAGVPQGSVLGPFLWNIMYDGLLNVDLPEGVEIVGFADDVAVVVTAKSTNTLELLTSESIRKTSIWFKRNGLELAVQKTEAVFITHKRIFTRPEITLENVIVPWEKSVKYLGVNIDDGLRYTEHIKKTAEKAATTAAALARLMPNIGGPREMKRRLLNSVVHSKILYGAEIWAEATQRETVRRKLAAVQRRSVIRVTSAYKTVSESAVLVVASTPPIDLLALEKREIYLECKKVYDQQRRKEIKREAKRAARQRLLGRWQERWKSSTTGQWTRKLIPKIQPWVERKHGEVGYQLTQVLTGHGSFRDYLLGIGRVEDRECVYCGEIDDAAHTVFVCSRWQRERAICQQKIEVHLEVKNLVDEMLQSEEKWTAIKHFIDIIIMQKEREDRELRNPYP